MNSIRKSKTLCQSSHCKANSLMSKNFDMNPIMKTTFKKMDKIESDINYILYKHKDKKCGDFLFKTSDINRKMNKIKKRIDHSHQEIAKHLQCQSENLIENQMIYNTHSLKKEQGKYLEDEYDVLKRTIEEMRKKLIEVNEEKNKFELMTMTYKEEIKYIKRDINEMSKSIERIKIDRQNVINEIKQQKNKIFVNVFLPGVGTIIGGVQLQKKYISYYILSGVLQFLLSWIFVGFLWAQASSLELYSFI